LHQIKKRRRKGGLLSLINPTTFRPPWRHRCLTTHRTLCYDSACSLAETSHLFHSQTKTTKQTTLDNMLVVMALFTWKPNQWTDFDIFFNPSGPSPPTPAICLQMCCAPGPRHPDSSIPKKMSLALSDSRFHNNLSIVCVCMY
jgi:hypothetical protein